ncbi:MULTISPECIES: spore coat protein [Paenisporosarcina]|uniref:Spore coat protein n=1 Tax=Paenisporosarcina antarctica TaxID=417367 RepID=A0A4P7A1P0_9BACL|nr:MULTISPECIES: spore coat protein [Paenisporosarcina]QBP42841.1 spore coat protein [Paenisporosarcina antarctica]
MTQNQQGQMSENMQAGPVTPEMNHGGHELFDVQELLSGAVAGLNQCVLLRPHIQDQELLTMLDNQFQFMQEEYNIIVDCFKTGQDPFKPTQSYKMSQNNDFIYGIKPTQPKKPIQSANELTDEIISGFLLGVHKTSASLKAMVALETTNPVVRRVIADSVPNCIEMAYEVSIYQNKHQYYQVPQLAKQDMMAIVNSFAPSQIKPGTMPN